MSMRIGYTTGVFDLFHIGHLNVLQNARRHCDFLMVGVTTDELAFELKGRRPIIPFAERLEIVSSIRAVDEVYPESTSDKLEAWSGLQFNVVFKGDDWRGTPKWNELERRFAEVGVKVVFLPYTKTTSSSIIRKIIEEY